MKRSPRPGYRPTQFSIFVALASPASPTPPHLSSPPLSRPPRVPVRAYGRDTNGLTAPQYPSLQNYVSCPTTCSKKPIVSSQILRQLKNDFDILFLQEINHSPILPHVYAYGSGTKATIVSNISPDKNSRGEHGSVLVCSPRLSRCSFITPVPRLDAVGLLAAAILTLPGAPPTLLVSVYAPSTDAHHSKIENILRPLMHQYPSHVMGGDTNCIMCPELDGANLQTDNEWPWLWRQVTSDPPRLIDTFRHFHPPARSFSRYPTPYRASSSRLDHILISPTASEIFHPVTYTSQVPPHPFSESPTTKKKVFRKLTEPEGSTHHDSLAPLAR